MKEASYKAGQQNPYTYRSTFGYSKKFPAYTFSKPYRKEPVTAYPSITDELRNDVGILKNSLDIKTSYIKDLRKARDSLISKLNIKDIYLENLSQRVKRYQEFFYKTKENEKEKPELTAITKNKYSDQKNYL